MKTIPYPKATVATTITTTARTKTSSPQAFRGGCPRLVVRSRPPFRGARFPLHGIQVVDYYECYIFSLYEDLPDHITTLGYYAVDPFGYVYEQDYLTGKYFIVE